MFFVSSYFPHYFESIKKNFLIFSIILAIQKHALLFHPLLQVKFLNTVLLKIKSLNVFCCFSNFVFDIYKSLFLYIFGITPENRFVNKNIKKLMNKKNLQIIWIPKQQRLFYLQFLKYSFPFSLYNPAPNPKDEEKTYNKQKCLHQI